MKYKKMPKNLVTQPLKEIEYEKRCLHLEDSMNLFAILDTDVKPFLMFTAIAKFEICRKICLFKLIVYPLQASNNMTYFCMKMLREAALLTVHLHTLTTGSVGTHIHSKKHICK